MYSMIPVQLTTVEGFVGALFLDGPTGEPGEIVCPNDPDIVFFPQGINIKYIKNVLPRTLQVYDPVNMTLIPFFSRDLVWSQNGTISICWDREEALHPIFDENHKGVLVALFAWCGADGSLFTFVGRDASNSNKLFISKTELKPGERFYEKNNLLFFPKDST